MLINAYQTNKPFSSLYHKGETLYYYNKQLEEHPFLFKNIQETFNMQESMIKAYLQKESEQFHFPVSTSPHSLQDQGLFFILISSNC